MVVVIKFECKGVSSSYGCLRKGCVILLWHSLGRSITSVGVEKVVFVFPDIVLAVFVLRAFLFLLVFRIVPWIGCVACDTP